MTFIPNTSYGKWIGRILFTMHAPWFDDGEQESNFHAYLQSSGNHSGGANHRTHGRVSLDGKQNCRQSAWTEEELDIEYHIPLITEETGMNEQAVRAQLEMEIFAPGSSEADGNEFARQFYADNIEEWEEEI